DLSACHRRVARDARGGRVNLPAITRNPWLRVAVVLAAAAGLGTLVWWRGPNWGQVGNAFTIVRWEWVVAAIGLNLVSVIARSVAFARDLRAADREGAPLGIHEPGGRARTWVRVAHLRNRERETSPAVGARRAQPLPAGDSDGPPGPGGPEVAAAGACRGRLPVPGLALSAARRLLHHACLP